MPKEGSTSNEKFEKTPWSTKLNSWLVQRFADLKSLFTDRPIADSNSSPLTVDIGRTYLGNTSNRLAKQVLDRASSSISIFRAAELPLISEASSFTLSRLASSPTVWQQALSLPWIRQNRRESTRLSRTQYESGEWQPIESNGQSSRDFQVTQHIQQYPAGTELPLDSDKANTDEVISKESDSLRSTTPLTLPITKKEPLTKNEPTRLDGIATSSSYNEKAPDKRSLDSIVGASSINQKIQSVSSIDNTYPAVINTHLLPSVSSRRLDRIADEPPYNTHTRSLPLITGKIETQLQTGEAGERTSKIPYVYRSEALKRTTDESQQGETPDYVETEEYREESAQVNQQYQSRYLSQSTSEVSTPVTQRHPIQPSSEMSTSITQRHLTQPSSDVLTPVTQRVPVRHSSLESRPYEVEKNTQESEISPLWRDSDQEQNQPLIESSSIDARQFNMPIIASSTVSQPTDETSIGAGHILPLMLTYGQSGTSQNKALPDQKLNLVTPVLADEISHRFSQSQLQKTTVRLDGTASNLTSTQGVTSGRGSGVLPSKQFTRPVSNVGQTSTSDSVTSRLKQQALEKARSIKTTAKEVKKSPRRAVIQRTIIEPDNAKSNSRPAEEVTSGEGSGDLPAKQTIQPVPKTGQSPMEEPVTNSLQREPEVTKVVHSPMGEVIKSLGQSEVQRTAVEPDSEVTQETIPQKASQSLSSSELQYRVEPRSKPEIGTTQTKEQLVESVFNRPEIPNLDTGTAGSINRDLVEGYTEKVLSYRQPLSLTSPVTRPINVIRNVSGTMDIPSQQLFRTAVGRQVYNKGEDHDLLQGKVYRTGLTDHRYINQPPMALPVTSSVRSKTESGFTLNEKLFKYTSDTIPELPYSWTHNSGNHSNIELALAPVSRAPETNNIVQKAENEPIESGGETAATKEPPLDLKALAREVYPYLRRMIMAERDRQPI